jgi:glycosyltransferase involved in cell wall biosynthesis
MKVLHVVPGMGSVYGGPSISIFNLASALAQQGIQVDIVTTNANGKSTIAAPTKTWIVHQDCHIQYFPCWYLKDYKISPQLSKWLWHHVRDYDVVNTHAVFSASLIPAYRSCQYYRVPYIIHPHGMLENWALQYKRWKKQPYYKLVEETALKRSYAVRVLAQSEVDSVNRLNTGVRSVLIPNGIWQSDYAQLGDRELFYQQFPETRNKTLILFLGRIDPKKGLDLLAQAFATVKQQFPTTHLILAGPDDIGFTPKAASYFAEMGCLDAVTFTGMLAGDMKQAALAAAQVYTAPSYSEGFSMSVLEGMASGLPCVITTGCNFPEAAAAQAAHIVEIEATAIAKALIYCLRDPEAAQAMGQRAKQLVFEHYSWETIGKQMLDVYQEIVTKSQPLVSANY